MSHDLVALIEAVKAGTEDPDWRKEALCAQTDNSLFHLDKGDSAAAGKRICAACPAREVCLATALANGWNHASLWGGQTPRERRIIARRLAVRAEARAQAATRAAESAA